MVYHESMTKPRKYLIGSFSLLISSLAMLSLTHSYFNVQSEAVRPAAQHVQVCQRQSTECHRASLDNSVLAVEGVWEQYAVADGQRHFMARLDIRKDGLNFMASPLELSADTFPKHAYRSYDHSFEDGIWSFREDWDDGQVGEFFLTRQANGEYHGFASPAECPYGFETVFVKVGG